MIYLRRFYTCKYVDFILVSIKSTQNRYQLLQPTHPPTNPSTYSARDFRVEKECWGRFRLVHSTGKIVISVVKFGFSLLILDTLHSSATLLWLYWFWTIIKLNILDAIHFTDLSLTLLTRNGESYKIEKVPGWWWCLLFVLAETKNRHQVHLPLGRYVP